MEAIQALYIWLSRFIQSTPKIEKEGHRGDHCRICYRAGYCDALQYVEEYVYEKWDVDG